MRRGELRIYGEMPMSRVEKIEKGRFCLLVTWDDGQETRLHRQALKDRPLFVGDETDPARYENELSQVQWKRGLEAALYMLEKGDRTEYKMREYLRGKYYTPQSVDAVVEKLKEQGLIDDERYAARYAENHPSEGRYALVRKLRMRGVDADTARETASSLSDEDQLSAARKAAEKLAGRYASDTPADRKRKMGQALARRGFSWDLIREVMGEEEDWD